MVDAGALAHPTVYVSAGRRGLEVELADGTGAEDEDLGSDLNARPVLPEDDAEAGAHAVAVMNYGTWQTRFGGAEDIVGRTLRLNNIIFTIVGVAPAGFEGVIAAEHPDIYLPLEFQGVVYGESAKHDVGRLWLDTFARLNPGVSRQQAAALLGNPERPG